MATKIASAATFRQKGGDISPPEDGFPYRPP
jgi:hypothetical protein